MLERLAPTEEHPDPWAEVNRVLEVERWPTPLYRPQPRAPLPPEEEWAPEWWAGDEEASQSFLRSMGVRL